VNFELQAPFSPAGSQPQAIQALATDFSRGARHRTLMGVTGSGKTFTVANLIRRLQLPTLVISHNKTLAAQLYNEFCGFFPRNRVEYYVSYYDYYQPESYIPQKDQYIEKDMSINERIEQMRLAATASLLSRPDVIVVASVSCIFSAGNPDYYRDLGFEITAGGPLERRDFLDRLLRIRYERNDTDTAPGRFRVRGDTVDFVPGHGNDVIRVELFGDTVERISRIDRLNGDILERLDYYHVFPAGQYVIPAAEMQRALAGIRMELDARLPELGLVEAHRLKQRTLYDLEMIEETGFCSGIENYSRHFDGRRPGEKPFCLLDYFGEKFLLVIDESHQTIPQLRAMYRGDYSRKKNLVDYGFRLPSAFDNRPLRFDEFEAYLDSQPTLFVSATPAEYELSRSGAPVEQVIRPTGLLDPPVDVHPIRGQVDDLQNRIRETLERGDRCLVTTLTKRMAEELTEHLSRNGFRARYLHSEIDTLERNEIIRELRLGIFDVLVGINLLREGLDIPEIGFIGILDADKEGFLRDARSLIQIIGRAARNAGSRVVLYADTITPSMDAAMRETRRRRLLQQEHNRRHAIRPRTIRKPVREKVVEVNDSRHIPRAELPNLIIELEKEMRNAAEKLDFEKAIALRDRAVNLKKRLEGG
jgi:excinuclease ABC subunit B